MSLLEALTAVDDLDDHLHASLQAPMSDRVRVDPEALAAAVARVRRECEGVLGGLTASRSRAALAALDAAAQDVKRVRVFGWSTVDAEPMYELLDELRASLAADLHTPDPNWKPPAYYSPLDALEDLLGDAPTVPLSNEVRLEPEEVRAAIDRVRSAVVLEGSSAGLAVVDRMVVMVDTAKRVPLSRQVRMDPRDLTDLCDELRQVVGPV